MRQEALNFWYDLGKEKQLEYWSKYCTNNFSPSLRPDELTGREIERIYSDYLNEKI